MNFNTEEEYKSKVESLTGALQEDGSDWKALFPDAFQTYNWRPGPFSKTLWSTETHAKKRNLIYLIDTHPGLDIPTYWSKEFYQWTAMTMARASGHERIRNLLKNPMLPLWFDSMDKYFKHMVASTTVASLMCNASAPNTPESVQEEIFFVLQEMLGKVGLSINAQVDEDWQRIEFIKKLIGREKLKQDMIKAAERGDSPMIASYSDRIALMVPHAVKVEHLFAGIFG